MIFTSTTRESVNLIFSQYYPVNVEPQDTVRPEDPEPWVEFDGLTHHPHGTNDRPGQCKYRPRPRYRAPANPILAGLRDDILGSADLGHDVVAHAQMWLSTLEDQDALPEHVEHARKVLTRLAALS